MFDDKNFKSNEKIANDANLVVGEGLGFFLLKESDDTFFLGRISEILTLNNLLLLFPKSCFYFDDSRGTWSKLLEHSGWSYDAKHGGGKFESLFIHNGPKYNMHINDSNGKGYRMQIRMYDDLEILKEAIKEEISDVAYEKIPEL